MKRRARRSTLLDLVVAVQDRVRSDDEVVAIVLHLLRTRRVILTGTFKGTRISSALAA
jgi:hypothetical protein